MPHENYTCSLFKLFVKTFSQWTREVSARHVNAQTAKDSGTEVMSNWFYAIQSIFSDR